MKTYYAAFPITLLALGSCAPTVKLSTPEPVKIDVAMKVDVYTHQQTSSGSTAETSAPKTPRETRRIRMMEVQSIKNDRLIGEGNEGYLVMRQAPTDPVYADYAQRILSEENSDRSRIFESDAKEQNKPIEAVAREFAKRAREASFPGEWIQDADGEWKNK
ncbi:MAG: DUF1318 domain-containing protein [Candidatus Methylacidiphilales bacterium]